MKTRTNTQGGSITCKSPHTYDSWEYGDAYDISEIMSRLWQT